MTVRDDPIRTARLVLRPLVPGDAPAIAAALQDWEIVRWLTVVPWPYGLGDAEWFIAEAQAGRVHPRAITLDDALVGIVAIDAELGYWLSRDHWGRGLMTEAARALVERHFDDPENPDLRSGYLAGNDRSGQVLRKLGFQEIRMRSRHSRILGREVPSHEMILRRQDLSPLR